MTPMNYQQALDSGVHWFYYRFHEVSEWALEEIHEIKSWGAEDTEYVQFLPIPTAEQLLGAVKGKCHACTDLESRIVVMGDPVLEPGDEVIILRKVKA